MVFSVLRIIIYSLKTLQFERKFIVQYSDCLCTDNEHPGLVIVIN